MISYPRKVVAHRGGGCCAPENTLAAMRKGLELGFRAVEFDVMLTHDDVPILMHDEFLGRTVAGSGPVSEKSASFMLECEAGSYMSNSQSHLKYGYATDAFEGEKVPTFESVFLYCQSNNIWMNIEIKPCPGFEEKVRKALIGVNWYRVN